MRSSIPSLLVQLAALVAGASGCQLDTASCSDYRPPAPKTVSVTGDTACQIAQSRVDLSTVSSCFAPPAGGPTSYSEPCAAACGAGYDTCTLPDDYVHAYVAAQEVPSACKDAGSAEDRGDAANPDAASSDGATSDAPSADSASEAGAPVCPAVSGTIQIACDSLPCTGRRTAGVGAPESVDTRSVGEYFAMCSHFEAASVFAFERLARELAAHGAPDRLVRAARRAAKDEVRHARKTRALARRYGAEPVWPRATPLPVRPLLEVAQENAAEGCVRETYGAVLGLVSAARATDADVRVAMRSIARDECRHAALSWRVAAWAASKLDARDRAAVQRAARAAVRELTEAPDDGLEAAHRSVTGMPSAVEGRRIAWMLDETLFEAA